MTSFVVVGNVLIPTLKLHCEVDWEVRMLGTNLRREKLVGASLYHYRLQ